MSHLPYAASIALVNGSPALVGTLSAFQISVYAGDWFQAPDGKLYFINSIEDNTHLTLDRNYGGTTASSIDVKFGRHSDLWASTAAANDKVSRLLETLQRGFSMTSTSSLAIGTGPKVFLVPEGMPILPGATVLAASRSDVEARKMGGVVTAYDGGTSMTVNVTAALGSGTYGDWNINIAGVVGPQGIQGIQGIQGDAGPNGTNGTNGQSLVPVGNYSGATAYTVGQIVDNAGSSWIALGPTTGNAPPALPTTFNTWWMLNAAKGDQGIQGIQGIQGPSGSLAFGALTPAALAAADTLVFGDASDSLNTKGATVQELIDLAVAAALDEIDDPIGAAIVFRGM